MNLRALMNRKKLSKHLVTISLLTLLPTGFSPLPQANAANAASLSSNSMEAICASTVSDTASAKLDVIVDGNYCVLSFLSSTNTWTPPVGTPAVDYLVVGGGGGGAGGRGGGGGAGGFLTGTISSPTRFSISVANGGAGGINNRYGDNGETSTVTYSATTINAVGGGGGGTSFGNASLFPARSGASGGGAGVFISFSTPNTEIGTPGGLGLSGQGNNGGSSGGKNPNDGNDSSYSYKGTCSQNWDQVRNTAGGGGAGGKGIAGRGGASTLLTPSNLTGCTPTVTPDGGPGATSKITGTVRFYAAGGGGSAGTFNKYSENINYYTAGPGAGGSGIGGAGSPIAGTNGGAAVPNSGSGGGGGGVSRTSDTDKGACATPSDADESCDGGAGGSGIVIVRFQFPTYTNERSECISGVANTSSSVLDYSFVVGDCLLTFSTPDSITAGTNSWTVPLGVETVSAIIVGGGGGGGSNFGGGGGGGQVLDSVTVPILVRPGSTYTLKIGKGGTTRGISSTASLGGFNGESSTITSTGFKLVALGGGGAAGSWDATYPYPYIDKTGWTSGGDGLQVNYNSDGSQSLNKSDSPVGGTNFRGGFGGDRAGYMGGGGGGGGAGGPGGGAVVISSGANHRGGDGGAGYSTAITGTVKCFGGGGGGGSNATDGGSTVAGATCGGANGGRSLTTINHATPGSGGGGGGGGGTTTPGSAKINGGTGATGVIIIRFRLPSPTGLSKNLNMACHSYSNGTTNLSDARASFFGKRFATDTTTSDFAFPSSLGLSDTASVNWGSAAPTGCGTGSNFTLYVSGYIRYINSSQAGNMSVYISTDMAVKLRFDGVDYIDQFFENVDDTRCNSQGVFLPPGESSGTYSCGSNLGYNGFTTSSAVPAGSWHFIEIWLHERDPVYGPWKPNGSNAAATLYYDSSGNSNRIYPSNLLSRSIPRTINASLTSDTQTAASVLVGTIDTSTSVTGGVNDSTTAMSLGGKFSFFESGTAIIGCQNLNSVKGSAQCSLGILPQDTIKRYYKIVFTPDTSTVSTDLQYNVFSTSIWDGVIYLAKLKNAKLRIGQYDAFPGISTYPLNIYADGTIYGALTRNLTDTGTANCALDASRFFLTATKVGTCTVTVNAAGDATHLSETTTATIYWIEFKNNFVTQVQSVPTQIALSGQVQIIKRSYETLTITNFQTIGGTIITSAAVGDVVRVVGTGFNSADMLTVVHLGGGNDLYLDPSIGGITSINTANAAANYIQFTIPDGTSTDYVIVESSKGSVASGAQLLITP